MAKSSRLPLTYEILLFLQRRNISRFKFTKYSLGAAEALIFRKENPAAKDVPYIISYPTLDTLNDTLAFSGYDIIDEIKLSAAEKNVSYHDALYEMYAFSNHLVRTAAVNYAYEIIKSYVDKNSTLKLSESIKKELWFAILYLIRNNASHADNMHQILKFDRCAWVSKNHGKTFEYDSIKISEGMYSDNIRYNSRQILSLLTTAYNYIENSDLFRQGK